ncbi:glycerophosphoryl diester phosphodiesterase [Paenibacillus phyllosphaerae]|uniref:Glycerophosphoryl diester phosphodiesterase n=1 Tax=Paenibacillus phyllosphaerae TaxID=274593 RepID=A0A7W5FM01_9BACL|nr:phosphatidylinositol-specific phospholipase C/glycerophosphodiester phosphodiesterase family protein [Paenibacillus phyllosphaerae]MBB3109557.1 glycerophosphoryl diester phosphodiesterase [Paenibacillus phyllosphaerae]
MRRPVILLLLSAIMLLTASGASAQEVHWTDEKLVAHGLGAIDGHTYTNTLEAFETNYAQGFRVFEVDLQLTSDGYLVSRHDWQPYLYRMFEQEPPAEGLRGEPLSLEAVKSLTVHNAYHILEFGELLKLIEQYPDVTFVTDTKDVDPAIIEKQFRTIAAAAGHDAKLLHRIVPQVYNQQMYHQIDAIFPFDSYIYTLYESPDTEDEVLGFVRHYDRIDAITLPESKANAGFLLRLKAASVKTYVHTINDTALMTDYMRRGTYGFYTDKVNGEQLLATTPEPTSLSSLLSAGMLKIVIQPILLPLLQWTYL